MPNNITELNKNLLCEQTKELEDFLSEKIVNQPRAVKLVVSAYDKFHSPLRQPEKPILSALFLGPSGVGKTYIPELLAEYFFDDPTAFTKIECANYVERHEISKLLGAPPGYMGYNDIPILSRENIELPAFKALIKKDKKAELISKEIEKMGSEGKKITSKSASDDLMKNYMKKVNQLQDYIDEKIKEVPLISIILFDEIEKAHQSLHNFLLEITSKGRTRLGNGEETLFYNSFIIMTSNVGSRSIAEIIKGKKEIGFKKEETLRSDEDEIYSRATKELKNIFSTEFLGRIEKNIVVFRNLSKNDIRKIMDNKIIDLLSFLGKNFPIELIINEEVKTFVIEKATDHPEYGARLLEDKIEKYIIDPLEQLINSGQVNKGDRILINLDDGKTIFSKDSAVNILNKNI